ncbi:hypothetical protein QTP88_002295 [Uroleucon formosanum]
MTTSCPCERNSRAMSKSRSWPMLYTVLEEETVGGASPASTVTAVTNGQQQQHHHQQQQQLLPDKGRVAHQLQMAAPAANVGRLLRRHYYPEAGWGWVVVTCACMVHLLNHGLQLSFGTLEKDVVHRFRDATYDRTGKRCRILRCLYTYRMFRLTKRTRYCLDFKYLGITNKLLIRMYMTIVNLGKNYFVNPNRKVLACRSRALKKLFEPMSWCTVFMHSNVYNDSIIAHERRGLVIV